MSSLPSREETLGFLRWQLEVCEKAQIVIDDPDGWLQRVRPKLRSDFIVHARTNYPASLRAEIAVLDLHGPLLSAFPHAARPPEASCGPCRTRSTCTTILPIIEAHAEQTRAWLAREAKDAE